MTQRNIFNYESLVHATAGVTGSIFAMSSVYPLDMVKFRKQLGDKEVTDKTTLGAIFHLLKTEGIGSLYRGIRPVVVSLGVSTFVYFYTFHGIKSIIPKELQNTKTDLALSIFAGVVNVLTTNPLWVVNNRLKNKEEVHFIGLLDGLFHIGSTEGMGALWNGVGPSLMLVTNPAIHFTIYEALKRKVNVKTASAYFILGAISKAIATVITYPLQLAQTRLRLSKDRKIGTAALLFLLMKKNGPKALFQGLESKMLQTVFATALMFVTYEKLAQLVFRLLLGSAKRKSV